MNTRDIEAFVAVVETGSISRAAARLNLTQPGLTRRIQNLELTVGAGLLDRQSKPLKPTNAGREAYELGRRVLRSVGDLVGTLGDGAPTGELRVGITPAIGDLALAEPIDAVRKAYPRLTVRAASEWSPALMHQVESGALDAAAVLTVSGIEPPLPLIAEPIGQLEIVIAAPRALKLPRRPSLQDVAAHAWIVNPEGCGTRRVIAAHMEAVGLTFEVAVEAISSEFRLALVARGVGLALVPALALDGSAFLDDVVTLRVPGLPRAMQGWIIHAPTLGKLAPPVELFRATFKASLAAAAGQPRRKSLRKKAR